MTDVHKIYWLVIATVIAALLYLLNPVLTPFIVAAMFAYMGDPLVDRLEVKMPRALAVTIVFLLISLIVLALVLVLLPQVQKQISLLISKLPLYVDRVQTNFLPWLRDALGLDLFEFDLKSLQKAFTQYWVEVGGVAAGIVSTLSKSGIAIVAWLANLILIPVLTFYLLRDWDILVARVHELIPRRVEPSISSMAKESDEMLGAFLRGQLLVMSGLGFIYSTGLWIVGLDFSLLIGLLAGLVSFVPYLGFLVGMLVAGIAALLQFQDASILLLVAIVFGVGQLVESFLLTPMLVGDRIGLHPVAVIFAVMAGGQLFGFFGVLLALPVAAVIMVILRHTHERYVNSEFYDNS
ncbi:MAG: AI-2E family transporter [Gammaproteobacteria bacterium]|nr:AI-2E family transporter [Gammaproteobacteria bacterium]MDH5731873.1 AI-2E family transporter [Gammaproteobacteria bacterium]